jgi:hypothetical protein
MGLITLMAQSIKFMVTIQDEIHTAARKILKEQYMTILKRKSYSFETDFGLIEFEVDNLDWHFKLNTTKSRNGDYLYTIGFESIVTILAEMLLYIWKHPKIVETSYQDASVSVRCEPATSWKPSHWGIE